MNEDLLSEREFQMLAKIREVARSQDEFDRFVKKYLEPMKAQ